MIIPNSGASYITSRASIVLHEVGHAVAATALGYDVQKIKVWKYRDGEGWRGDTDIVPSRPMRHGAVIEVAGNLAQMMFDPEWRRQDMAEYEDVEGADADVVIAATTILKRNADSVQALARVLDRHKVVRRARLATLLHSVECVS
jgi:hypothetical protein